MSITVFYSWQHDTHPPSNHYFIRDAAQKAIKALNADLHLDLSPRPQSVVLDHDTKGKPGHPEIVNVILEKIKNCQIFLADLTFVGTTRGHKARNQKTKKTKSTTKFLPNPNVLFELGYAFHVLDDSQFIFVQNTGYGNPEKGIFDLAHRRHPLAYSLAPDSSPTERKQASKALTEEIKKALSGILIKIDREETRAAEIQLSDVQQRCEREREEFHQSIKQGRFLSACNNDPVHALCIFPHKSRKDAIDWKKHLQRAKKGLKPLAVDRWAHKLQGPELRAFHMDGIVTGRALTTLDKDGTILAATMEPPLVYPTGEKVPFTGEKISDIAIEHITRDTIKTVQRYVRMLHEINVRGPWHVSTSLLSLPRCRIPFTERYYVTMEEEFDGGDIEPGLILMPPEAHQMELHEIAIFLRPVFDSIWQYFNMNGALDFDDSGQWLG